MLLDQPAGVFASRSGSDQEIGFVFSSEANGYFLCAGRGPGMRLQADQNYRTNSGLAQSRKGHHSLNTPAASNTLGRHSVCLRLQNSNAPAPASRISLRVGALTMNGGKKL